MSHEFSRREILTLATGGALLAGQMPAAGADTVLDFNPVLHPLGSRDGVYTPARGESVMQFGFDFPEASLQVDSLLFGFRVQTFENVYAIDPALTRVARTAEGVSFTKMEEGNAVFEVLAGTYVLSAPR